MAAKSEYKRLPGRSRRIISVFASESNQLYLASDHLVHVYKTNRYTEAYKRFEYGDIQAIVVRKTPAGMYINAALGIVALAFAAAAAISGIPTGFDAPAEVFFAAAAGVITAIAIVHALLYGPTCTSCLVTPVQVEPLPSLGRWRSARRAVALIAEQTAVAQGVASDPAALVEPLRDRVEAWLTAKTANLRLEMGHAHAVLFSYAIFDAFICAVDIYNPFFMPPALSFLFLIVWVLTIFVALVRQKESTLPPGLKQLTIGYALAAALLLFISFMLSSIASSDPGTNESTGMGIVLQFIATANLVLDLVCAVPGLMMLTRYWSNLRAVPDTDEDF